MNTIIILLIIVIPITNIVVGFLVLKSIQVGLKWQMQAKEGKEPELKSPISQVVDAVQQSKFDKVNQTSQDTIKEWINGA